MVNTTRISAYGAYRAADDALRDGRGCANPISSLTIMQVTPDVLMRACLTDDTR